MDKDKQEKLAQKKSNEIFNSITEKVKPENQNQTHNSRREGMGPVSYTHLPRICPDLLFQRRKK